MENNMQDEIYKKHLQAIKDYIDNEIKPQMLEKFSGFTCSTLLPTVYELLQSLECDLDVLSHNIKSRDGE